MSFNGINTSINNLYLTSFAKSRSICAENPTGGKGDACKCELEDGVCYNHARDLGKGWKVNPYVVLKPNTETVLADITGPGCIKHIWATPTGTWREQIIRFYWEDQEMPSVECPIGDFFACGLGIFAQISSLAVCVNPGSALNCYWPMPFRKRCRITIENLSQEESIFFYQIDYILTEVEDNIAYFHAQFRRKNPLPYKEVYTVLDNVQGKGHYVGTYMCWGVNNCGWWGEGEFKFYLDGDKEYPTICSTGTEDYFCGSYNFESLKYTRKANKLIKEKAGSYVTFSTPYSGMPQVIIPDGCYSSQQRFSLYRWHINDPIRFEHDIRVTVQALGWRSDGRYLPLQDDISSVAYWYQTLPTIPFPDLPDKDYLEII